MSDWATVAASAQRRVLDAIPEQWRLPSAMLQDVTAATGIPARVMSAEQLRITEMPATELQRQLAAGKLQCVQVTEAFCFRTAIAHQLVSDKQLGGKVLTCQTNCLTAFFPDASLQRAKELDAYFLETGRTVGPLHGLPMGVKDQNNLCGYPVTIGYLSWHDVVADDDAQIIKQLRNAGALFVGKTTMPQTGMALETYSRLWGRTLNPHNTKLAAGGSSGGDCVLIAMRGAVSAACSDIGGSIRVPAAFNGLYAIKPTSERTPKAGLRSTVVGQMSIKVSSGPAAHSLDDVELFVKELNAFPHARFEPGVFPLPWRSIAPPREKLCFGVFDFDGVCMPHPPIRRAIKEAADRLQREGHEVIPIELPLDLWQVAETTWRLYMQTGAKEAKEYAAMGDEPIINHLAAYLDVFKVEELKATELYALHAKQLAYKYAMSNFWTDSAKRTASRRAFDGILCPVNASASFPHKFVCWWGYSTMWNILDYPSLVLPCKKFEISAEHDPVAAYTPLASNPFDRATHEIYDPHLFSSQPVALQLVGRPYMDEELLAVGRVVDQVINGSN